MITKHQFKDAQLTGWKLLLKAGIPLKEFELQQIAVADFGLGELESFGAQIVTLVDTEKIGAKLIAMHPNQIMPEHWHPKINNYQGKEETIRVQFGALYMYIPGDKTPRLTANIPENKNKFFKSRHEIIMNPGDQITIPPQVPHWFQAGPEGVVVWSFSTKVIDLQDKFTDPNIIRETIIIDDEQS